MIDAKETLTREALDKRIRFHTDLAVMEADFSGFNFDSSVTVNLFYDRLEARIRETGEDKWFFLVNLHGTRIDPSAWVAYSRRGRALNMAHSMGSVRFDPSDETRRQIERAANTEAFDPNLFTNRDDALKRIAALPTQRRKRREQALTHTVAEFDLRVSFIEDLVVMDVDFSDFVFHHGRDVDDFYDYVEDRIKATDRKWFFLVNLNGCEIMPEAWVRYAHRGKRLNEAASLGSVRYAAGSETEQDIRLRAESQGFRPNIRNTREEALARIAEIREELIAKGV